MEDKFFYNKTLFSSFLFVSVKYLKFQLGKDKKANLNVINFLLLS